MNFNWEGQEVMWKGVSWVSNVPLTFIELKSLCSLNNEPYLCYYEKLEGDSNQTKLQDSNLEIHQIV